MSLFQSSPRTPLHKRRISYNGYAREDGLWEVEARITDTKAYDFKMLNGIRHAGEYVHDLRAHVIYDSKLVIQDIHVESVAVPYTGYCDTIAPVYQELIGVSLMKGFRKVLGEKFGGVCGCTHITELLQALPTAAIQTMVGQVRPIVDGNKKPFAIDQCHALAAGGDVVKQFYPTWYAPRSGENQPD